MDEERSSCWKTCAATIFRHLTVENLLRKLLSGEITLPVVRIENSQKAARGVHLVDLAAYIDRQREKALKESRQLSGSLQYDSGTT